jgi:hypothetical protein
MLLYATRCMHASRAHGGQRAAAVRTVRMSVVSYAVRAEDLLGRFCLTRVFIGV